MNIGILNSGGDCPGLNAVIEGVVCAAHRRGWNVIGFHDGFEGLLSEARHERYDVLTPEKCRCIRAQGGTIIGTVNTGNFIVLEGDNHKVELDPIVLKKTQATVERLELGALIVVGGDGSQSTALLLSAIGLPVVGVPKTIDNDLGSTDVTFGFNTATQIISNSIDNLRTTANAHGRIMVVEVMGRHAGWLAIAGGITGSADVILIPEIPFEVDNVIESVKQRRAAGQKEIIVVVSEGARISEALITLDAETKGQVRLGGIGKAIAKMLEAATNIETRECSLGHLQRGGSPVAYDRILGVRFGVYAVGMIERGEFSHMASLQGTEMVSVSIEEAVRTLHLVDPKCQLVQTARDLGICLGD